MWSGVLTSARRDADHCLVGYFKYEKLGMPSMSYHPDFSHPASYPYVFFHSDNARADGMTASNFRNADVEALIQGITWQTQPPRPRC